LRVERQKYLVFGRDMRLVGYEVGADRERVALTPKSSQETRALGKFLQGLEFSFGVLRVGEIERHLEAFDVWEPG